MTVLDMDAMTWTCNVCRDVRPDAQISVAHRTGPIPEARWNIRYCNDRIACTAYAQQEGEWTGPPQYRFNVRVPVRGVDIEDLDVIDAILQRTSCHIEWTSFQDRTRAIILIPADDRDTAVPHAVAELQRLQLDIDPRGITVGVVR